MCKLTLLGFMFLLRIQMPLVDGQSLDDRSKKQSVDSSYPGGKDAMELFIKKNLIYPEMAKKEKIEGVVVVRFYVELDGSRSELTCIKSLGFGMDEEAIRIIRLMPAMNPARINGKKIRSWTMIPIKFQL